MRQRLASLASVLGVLLLLGIAIAVLPGIQQQVAASSTGGPAALNFGLDAAAGQHAPGVVHAKAAGTLSIYQGSFGSLAAYPGRPVSITISYYWSGDGPAPNAVVTEQLPPQISISSTTPAFSGRSGDTLVWNLGTLTQTAFSAITIEGSIRPDAVIGSEATATASISADVDDSDTSDNTSELKLQIAEAKPNLFLWKFGLLEELENGSFFETEAGSDTSFEIYYGNLSAIAAGSATLTDTLPVGVQYLSAEPAPTSINGNNLVWSLGDVGGWSFGQVKVNVRTNVTGTLDNQAVLSATGGYSETSSFQFRSVALSQPRLLKPAAKSNSAEAPLIIGTRSAFSGLARAGAQVVLYEGSAAGCFGDFIGCSPRALFTTTVAANRTWAITPTTPFTNGLHYLYLRAHKDGASSAPWFNFWEPLFVKVDDSFEKAGWDVDNFVIDNGGHESRPGAVGGNSGTTPNQDLTIKIRSQAPPTITNPVYWSPNHDLRLVIRDGDSVITETLKPSRVEPVTTTTSAARQSSGGGVSALGYWGYEDFIYVHKGFGPGAKVEIWCLPIYYDEDGIALVGLVWVKCHEILVDPAGYVYDREKAGTDIPWPGEPAPEYLIPNATVTVTVRQGDNTFVPWDAAKTGQVNPQVTDTTAGDGITKPGYYAFYVPSGQYKVLATAPGCSAYESPILTVVETPVFHNVPMRCTNSAAGRITYTVGVPTVIMGPG